ncbi:hypothetical protein JAAARDRAFT_132232 [Jaapia argillacea MUCL 33604]|uniref:WD repeat-containing protein JIP5 n=1 Tax=Jaapia argillacea MUCL 33604 TaxID=933084 RepID=A0A067Q2S4_9AGAM|nr:hypothetical protein JAAARDRAFT_132232 [Jaapia argillacea MUCL 33604]
MPDIKVRTQIFDLTFHPTLPILYTALLTGDIKAFKYDADQGSSHENLWSVRPSKRSCRGLDVSEDGGRVWGVGKGKALLWVFFLDFFWIGEGADGFLGSSIDSATGKVVEMRNAAHESPINRIKRLMPGLLCTGDDDGVIKLWDPRKEDAIRGYTHHFDFISDFLWLEDKKHLVSTSGDGTLSVIDIRSNKKDPFAHSEDQEDELLSIVSIKNGSKVVVGTQLGILSVFNRKSGWGDCVDRIPGHPHSIDTLCNLPSIYPSAHSTILTGSSDGLVRAVELFPTKLLGVVADHGEFPVERVKVDMGGEGRWVGSVGHEEVVRLTDLREVFEDEEGRGEEEGESESGQGEGDEESGEVDGSEKDSDDEDAAMTISEKAEEGTEKKAADSDDEEGDDSDVPQLQKRKRKKDKDPLTVPERRKKGRNEIVGDPSFFSDL